MYKPFLFILLFFLQAPLYLLAQSNVKTDELKRYSYQVDTTKTPVDTISFLYDSVQVTATVKNNYVAATCLFTKSKSILSIQYYWKDKDLVLVKTIEQSPLYSDMVFERFFYYEKGLLLDEQHHSTVRICMPIPMNTSIFELYGYNQSLNGPFMKKFTSDLLAKINAQQHLSTPSVN